MKHVVRVLIAAFLLAGCADDSAPKTGPRVEYVGPYRVVYLEGTPYEMGQQHAELLRAELEIGVQAISDEIILRFLFGVAEALDLDDIAREISNPDVIEECAGFVSVSAEIGWTETHCIVLAAPDVVGEFAEDGKPRDDTDITPEEEPGFYKRLTPGCTQIIANGPATRDGRLYHARILDWDYVQFILDYPTVFVRTPAEGIPHVTIGFPGNIVPFQGMNAYGIAAATNEIHARDNSVHDRVGESHSQLLLKVLTHARSLEEAQTMIEQANHMTMEVMAVSEGSTRDGAVFEMAPPLAAHRYLEDGVAFASNHFVEESTADLDAEPASDSTMLRWDRVEELVARDGADSHYGDLDPETLVQVMRDRLNPWTDEESPDDAFCDELSLATDGALFALVFDPENLAFWLAAGQVPVPLQPFTGFSLGEMLGMAGYEGTTPADIP